MISTGPVDLLRFGPQFQLRKSQNLTIRLIEEWMGKYSEQVKTAVVKDEDNISVLS